MVNLVQCAGVTEVMVQWLPLSLILLGSPPNMGNPQIVFLSYQLSSNAFTCAGALDTVQKQTISYFAQRDVLQFKYTPWTRIKASDFGSGQMLWLRSPPPGSWPSSNSLGL